MPHKKLVECHFLIPLHRDAELSDGDVHAHKCWKWLNDQLFACFEGWTTSGNRFTGVWKNPRTGKRVSDQSRQYIAAIPRTSVRVLREILKTACRVFEQECIYLSVAGEVEFVEP